MRRRYPPNVLSVVVPLYNEERSVETLYGEIAAALEPSGEPYEVIFVDDGSTDSSLAVLTQLHAETTNVVVVHLRRNFGKAAALQAGFLEAKGDVVVTIDADLQDDPAEIPQLLAKLDEGFDLVSGWKSRRNDPWTRRLLSRVFNWATAVVSGVRLHDVNCGLKAYRAEALRGHSPLRRAPPLHPGPRRVQGLSHRRDSGPSPAAAARPLQVRAQSLPPRFVRPRDRHLHGALPASPAPSLRRRRSAVGLRGIRHPPLPDRDQDRWGRRSAIARCSHSESCSSSSAIQFISLGLVSELITSQHEERMDERERMDSVVEEVLR